MVRRTAVALLAALAAGVVLGPPPAAAQAQGHLCCNLRSDGSWISDSNYAESGKTIVPFGTPVRVLGQGRWRVHVEIDGQRQAIGNDYSRDLGMDAFERRYVVAEDPRPLVAALPEKLRRAIGSARVTPGMTRGQVAIAIGWPISSETPHLDARVWKYWLWTFSPFEVHFDDDGRVRRVTSDPETLARVYLP
jgi:hypothetical protein